MYSVKKWLFPTLDVSDGSDRVNKEIGEAFRVKEPHILAYDTEDEIVYHTEEEITNAMSRIYPSFLIEYTQTYIKSEKELHDCQKELENLVNAVKEFLNFESNRFFISLSDFIEDKIIERIEEEIKKRKFLIVNKNDKMLMFLNHKHYFTQSVELAYLFDTKKEAVEYNKKIKDEVKYNTYIKILHNGLILTPKKF